MSTGVTVLIIAIVVIAVIVVIALVRRSRKQQHRPHMGLPDLGALSTDGLDKQHAAAPRDQSPGTRSTSETAPPENRA
jgi:hypothetical protein